MKKINWYEKFFAASVHFLVTMLLAGLAAVLVFFIWFPAPFAEMVGGIRLFALVVCSDLVLGPLISLVIFNSKKPRRELVRDYIVVGLIQMVALIYGISVVAGSRPVFIAFTQDRLEVIVASELESADLAEAPEALYRSLTWVGPLFVAVQMPEDLKERSEVLFSAVGGKDVQLMPKYYRSYETMLDQIESKSQPLSALITKHEEGRELVGRVLKELKRSEESLRWLPVHHRFGFWTALIDVKTGYPVKYLSIDPY